MYADGSGFCTESVMKVQMDVLTALPFARGGQTHIWLCSDNLKLGRRCHETVKTLNVFERGADFGPDDHGRPMERGVCSVGHGRAVGDRPGT